MCLDDVMTVEMKARRSTVEKIKSDFFISGVSDDLVRVVVDEWKKWPKSWQDKDFIAEGRKPGKGKWQ